MRASSGDCPLNKVPWTMVTIYGSIRNLDNHIVVLPKCNRHFGHTAPPAWREASSLVICEMGMLCDRESAGWLLESTAVGPPGVAGPTYTPPVRIASMRARFLSVKARSARAPRSARFAPRGWRRLALKSCGRRAAPMPAPSAPTIALAPAPARSTLAPWRGGPRRCRAASESRGLGSARIGGMP